MNRTLQNCHPIPVAMPFSGGMDSFANLHFFRKQEPTTPAHFYYFEHGYDIPGEYEIAQEILHPFPLHLVPLDLIDLTRQPSTFVPFRNLFFGLYLFGLGFERVCFSFSAEDTEHYDTSDEFLGELQDLCQKHLHRPGEAFTCLRPYSRMSYTENIFVHDPENFQGLVKTHTCLASIPGCRKCLTCLKREIAFLNVQPGQLTKEFEFLDHWTQDSVHTYLVDRLYTDCLAGIIKGKTATEYLSFLQEFHNGELLTRSKADAQ